MSDDELRIIIMVTAQNVCKVLEKMVADIKERLDNDNGETCDGCEYYDAEEEYCKAFDCDGLDWPTLPCEEVRDD